jgi:hypothetical protein
LPPTQLCQAGERRELLFDVIHGTSAGQRFQRLMLPLGCIMQPFVGSCDVAQGHYRRPLQSRSTDEVALESPGVGQLPCTVRQRSGPVCIAEPQRSLGEERADHTLRLRRILSHKHPRRPL